MFEVVSSRVSFPDLDAGTLEYWKAQDVFRRSVDDRPEAPLFMMYEGPPTANGSPGIHHALARIFKDVISRYRTMKGYRVIRKGGWDTHGLPVELPTFLREYRKLAAQCAAEGSRVPGSGVRVRRLAKR